MRRCLMAVALVMLAGTGCRGRVVVPLSEALAPAVAEESSAPAAINEPTVLMGDFEDARPARVEESRVLWGAVPLVGLFLPERTIHPRPEATANESRPVLLARDRAFQGDLADDLAGAVAAHLVQRGVFRVVDRVGDGVALPDVRRFDYTMTGRIDRAEIDRTVYSWGLDFFGVLDLSLLLPVLGLPVERSSGELAVTMSLRERASGRVLLEREYVVSEAGFSTGLYGRGGLESGSGAAVPPTGVVLGRLTARFLDEFAEDLAEVLVKEGG